MNLFCTQKWNVYKNGHESIDTDQIAGAGKINCQIKLLIKYINVR